MPASEAELVAYAQAHNAAHVDLIESTARAVTALWDRLNPISDAELAQWLRLSVPAVRAAQTRAVQLGVGFIDGYARLAGETPEIDVDVADVVGNVRGDVTLETVYSRPVITARSALADGLTDQALAIGRARLDATVRADVQLAGRDGAAAAMRAEPTIVGYRRVTDGKACAKCLMASTQRYHVADLLPIHNRCGCTVAPIIGTKDPGLVIDRELLKRLKATGVDRQVYYDNAVGRARQAAQNARRNVADLRAELGRELDPERIRRLEKRLAAAERDVVAREARVEAITAERNVWRQQQATPPIERYRREVAVREHGELGPVLTDAGDAFDTVDDVVEAIPAPAPSGPTGKPLRDAFEFDTPRAEKLFGDLLDKVAAHHGLADRDVLGTTRIKFRKGGPNARKGGHFSPGKRGPKPRRIRGDSTYVERYTEWINSERTPEILVIDRGDDTSRLSFLHEVGHRVDSLHGPASRGYATTSADREPGSHDAVLAFFAAAKDTPTIRDAYRNYGSQIGYVNYFRSGEEVWARAYSQYMANELGERAALEATRRASPHYQWPDDEFEQLAPLVENVLRTRGMLR